ncbi:DUF616 domain-containing protein [Echinicola marina]|uniref:glycosyltransferase domain-containing protein n=1 Tax=Echinicola marina TaxID=2859768 RepID=UPI001CF70CBD|nr:glycosyltransferase domain-containing protein [Echinicola marina]UCS94151.1 DUF616 domain-containing protein [Echinicola marina]
MSKKLLYTVVTNNYDNLKPVKKYKGFDFWVYTDDANLNVEGWETKLLPVSNDPIKQQRLIKINSFKYSEGYDLSIYVDANIELVQDPNNFVNEQFEKGMLTSIHPKRSSVREESKEILKKHKDTFESVQETIEFAKNLGFDDRIGLFETMIIIRDKSDQVQVLEKKWAEILAAYSHRDQISLPIACFLTGVKIHSIPRKTTFKYMKRNRGHNVSLKFKDGGVRYITVFSNFKNSLKKKVKFFFGKH